MSAVRGVPDIEFETAPVGPLAGSLQVPGDKSISHRAVMLGAIAEGESTVTGFLSGSDCLATVAAMRAMGVHTAESGPGMLRIHGAGLRGLQAPAGPLDLGNSGTSMRLMAGLLAGQAFDTTLTGDSSLSVRPMRRVTGPLGQMGAAIETSDDGTPPVKISGGRRLSGIDYEMPVASAQIKSSLLLAGLYAHGTTRIREPASTRDHTERMLGGFAYRVERRDDWVSVMGGGKLCAQRVDVPGDISSAAFFMVAATIVPGSDLLLTNVGVNPTRSGAITILRQMGARIEMQNERQASGEPVADIRVRSAQLQGIDVPRGLVPLAIDEFPILFVAAACARGETRLSGAAELRVKESDRIEVMADGLAACGIRARPAPDGMAVKGGKLCGGEVDSHGDHRVAMAFAVAGARAQGPIRIGRCANVDTSYPGFVDDARDVGLQLTRISHHDDEPSLDL
ncbi:MAG: 3-phosphoshikimate 1-carboxyvinyltransferase [Gammaproteobacteria bacterium]